MTQAKTTLGAILIIALAGLLAFYLVITTQKTQGSAPSGLPATFASSTGMTVTATAQRAFATSSSCSSRVITTLAQPVMLTFGDQNGQVPTISFGVFQAASSTVAYDSGLYGCGAVKVIGFIPSTTVYLGEY